VWRELANLAGVLTVARIPLAAGFLFVPDLRSALVLYVCGALTDLFDGYVARRTGQVSEAGAVADGVADKTFHGAVAAWTVWQGSLPAWWLALWFSRELGQLVVIAWYWRQRRRHGLHALPLGKATTLALAVACTTTLLGWRDLALATSWIVGSLGLASAAEYARREARWGKLRAP
jgi:phosphatidylglycerophosphate synthase